ncbi:5654_t:CDS:2, partial [Gigaspora margarita]
IEQTTPDTKDHKFNDLYEVIRTIGKSQLIIIMEFSYGRKIDFEIKYLVRSLLSVYMLQRFMRTKIPASFSDFEQFAKYIKELMNWQ